MQKYVFFVLCFLCILMNAQEKDSTFYKVKTIEFSAKAISLENYRNPARMQDFGDFHFSEINVTYLNQNHERYLIQTPKGEETFGLNAKSYAPLNDKTTLFAHASYHNGTLKNQVWNESLDYDVIYPYVMADSVGGDLKVETYAFSGGLSSKLNQLDYGAHLSYQAKLGSRDKDPRAKNISSDLDVKAGMSYTTKFDLKLGLHAGIRKYTQSNDLDFYNQLGVPNVFHLNGLGNYNALFDGSNYETFYDGFGYQSGIQLNTINELFSFQALYKKNEIDKIIQLNRKVESSTLHHELFEATAVKLFSIKHSKVGLKLKFLKENRGGIEPTFSGLNPENAEIINRSEKFKLEKMHYELRLVYLRQFNHAHFSLQPFIHFQNLKEQYTFPSNFQEFDDRNMGININYLQTFKNQHHLFVSSYVKSHQNTDNSSVFNINDVDMQRFVMQNYDYLTENYMETEWQLTYAIPFKNLNLFIDSALRFTFFPDKNNSFYTFGAGILF